ncbi:MAG: LPS export ABC transporter permease LptF [Deltaproteobacteria bacterium]|nr:LPS export ABC transporter permease LptF [Deltaproteobacteria bacterium]
MGLTLSKYIFDEIWPTFLVSLFVAVFIILATRMLSIIELVVNRGAHATQMGMMLFYLVPDIVVFALPAATLMAVLVAFLRLSADSEIIAMKASGISLYQMLPPVVLLSLVAFLLALFMNGFAVPWGNRSFKDLVFQIARSRADLGIKERVFSEPFDNVMFYVNHLSAHDHLMRDVFVADRRDKKATNTIVAREGKILVDPDKRSITLRFRKGTIFIVEKSLASARTIRFDTYDLHIGLQDIMAALQSRRKHASEMRIRELLQGIETAKPATRLYNKMKIKLYEKLSVPLAVFLMGLIGVPLGARIRARGRSTGVGISLAIFLAYYVSFTGVERVCETGALAPEIGIWLPDIFLLLSCVYLLRRVSRERSINIFKRAAEA